MFPDANDECTRGESEPDPFVLARPPIFVTADEPLLVFRSAEQAQRWLEWPDVEDGLYRGYDSEGRLIEFGVKESRVKRRFLPGSRIDRDVVLTIEQDPRHADELRNALTRALSRLRPPEAAPATFAELKALAVDRFGFAD
jgi:hypothetical protein